MSEQGIDFNKITAEKNKDKTTRNHTDGTTHTPEKMDRKKQARKTKLYKVRQTCAEQ